MAQKYNIIDLFSGAGGLSKGFLDAGYNVLAGIDYNSDAVETYGYNFKDALALEKDLYKPEEVFEDIENQLNDEIDLIIAGPPCQGFSLTGSRDLSDTRNELYKAVVKGVEHFQPKSFLIENVPGMATLYKGKVKEQIINTFEDLNYEVYVTDKPLVSADYGVPQVRKRMFFVGFRKDLEYGQFNFPESYLDKKDYVTSEEAISDLPSLENDLGENISEYKQEPQSEYQMRMRENATELYNHVGTNHTEKVKWVINQVPEGGNHKDLPEGVGDSRKFNEAWTRYHSQKPSKTIDTGHRNHFHYKWNRVPTVRENARLQSFPDDFVFLGSKTSQYRQVGNAVPPIMTEAIALEMKKVLNRETTKERNDLGQISLQL